MVVKHSETKTLTDKGSEKQPRSVISAPKPIDVTDRTKRNDTNPSARSRSVIMKSPDAGKDKAHSPKAEPIHSTVVRRDKPVHLPAIAQRDVGKLRSHPVASFASGGRNNMIPAVGGERNIIQTAEGNRRAYIWRK
jgi:hypothetical protein